MYTAHSKRRMTILFFAIRTELFSNFNVVFEVGVNLIQLLKNTNKRSIT